MLADSPRQAAARAALDGGDWRAAVTDAEAAIRDGAGGDAYLILATALWCGYQIDRAIIEMKAAYRCYTRESRPERAAWLAAWIAVEELTSRGNPAVARGWLQRARRFLEDRPACAERGWFLLWEAAFSSAERLPAAAEEALQLARACGDRDLELESLLVQGVVLVQGGDIDDGMVLLDEVMAAVTGGETATPLVVGDAFCLTLGACEQAGDFKRAEEWCRVGLRAADSRANGFLRASCLASYGWILTVLGRWAEGESRLGEAIDLFRAGHRQLLPHASIRLAELRRRQGRVSEAARLLRDVPRSAGSLQVLAELALDAGDASTALALAREMAVLGQGFPVTEHVVALQLTVRAAAALGDVEAAATALDELERRASRMRTDALCGAVSVARGALRHARGEGEQGAAEYERAAACFDLARAPFEAARARLAAAEALGGAGRGEEAHRMRMEAHEQLAALGQRRSQGSLTPREREVLTMLAQGLSNATIAAGMGLSPHTVHRHVANVLRKLDASTRAGAVARAAHLGLV
ncbi:MAG: LuxR C-terminal-related transcriptional regulator [Candidatus Dormibacteria bacterium]